MGIVRVNWLEAAPSELHQQLMARRGFQAHAIVKRSIFASLGECIKPQLVE
jgi:hypothetical protein